MAYRPVLLLLALLLTLCSSCASADEADTLQFLWSLAANYPVALANWTGSNYCNWKYMSCDTGIALSLEHAELDAGGTLPDVVTDGVLLTNIYLGNCFTTPTTLPASWSRMSKLRQLMMESYQITGTLPAAWGALKNQIWISVYKTSITGTLPPEWGTIGVSRLVIQHTPITGTLPPEWGRMSKLFVFNLENVTVSGSLPVAWILMPKLSQLTLTSTFIGGALPAEWGYSGALPNLKYFEFEGTTFCGCEPESWKSKAYLHKAVQNTPLADSTNCATQNACPAQSNCADTTTKQPADTTTKQPGPDVTEKPGRDGARGRLGSSAVTAVTAVCVIALGLCL